MKIEHGTIPQKYVPGIFIVLEGINTNLELGVVQEILSVLKELTSHLLLLKVVSF